MGTGPYALTESRPDQVVLTARDDYWGERARVRKFVIRRTDDDNARATQLRDGADGTVLPPELAQAAAKDGYRVVPAVANDWRAITLPSGNPVAGDPAVRKALNFAVDRQGMVDHIMGGHGAPMSTLVGQVYGETYDPAQDFGYDRAEAARVLDAAGWRVGTDGIRERDGRRASFEIAYYPTEVLRRDLTMAVVSDAKKVGIEITPVAVDKKRMTPEYLAQTAFLLGGGGQRYTVDSQLYTKLHSRYAAPGVGSKWDNASDYVNPKIDQLLDAARGEANPQRRTELSIGLLRGIGNTKAGMQSTLIGYFAIGVPAMVVFGFGLGWQAPGIWLGLCLGFTATAFLVWRRLLRGIADLATPTRESVSAIG
ncbi:ABC transporter substrate-binding protein [Nocardia sp. CA-128927]|uniref:ABC transporter substrate-binding protein n=1 Tax=Nocardia sp. CA-128927 TaxID=3239975 RepID=UPI003D95A639